MLLGTGLQERVAGASNCDWQMGAEGRRGAGRPWSCGLTGGEEPELPSAGGTLTRHDHVVSTIPRHPEPEILKLWLTVRQ